MVGDCHVGLAVVCSCIPSPPVPDPSLLTVVITGGTGVTGMTGREQSERVGG